MFKIIFIALLIIIMSGCSPQKNSLQKDMAYNVGDNIEICPKFDTLSDNKDSVHFTLKMLNTDKSDSQTTWMASNTNIADCYDLSEMKWSLGYSSAGVDHNLDFYETVRTGEYILTTRMAIKEDNEEYSFVKTEDIKIIIK